MDDAFDKLRWAEHHLEVLRREIEPFEQRDAHTITFTVDANAGKYTFYVHGLEEPPENDWGLIIGDCLHNARTALDYLMVRLFSLVTGDDPRLIERVEFPIFDDPERFEPKSGKTAPSVSEMRKYPEFRGYLARIEELQPFNRGNLSIWGTADVENFPAYMSPKALMHHLPVSLRQLAALDNLDKHRVLHATWTGLKTPGDVPGIALKPPADFVETGGSAYVGPLKDDTEIASLEFKIPLPSDWQPSEVEMKRAFPLQVAIYDEGRFAERVLEVLPFCLWGVESVLNIFSPVFGDSPQPPLPVTAIPDLG